MEKKNGFLDSCIWIGCMKFNLLWREYMSLEVNVLNNSPKISDLPKREVFQPNLSQNDPKRG